MKAQDPISNNTPLGAYTGSNQNVIINNDPFFSQLTSTANNLGSNTQLNFVGGDGNAIQGPNSLTLNSIVYGKDNILNDGENNLLIGINNDLLDGTSSAILGRNNTIDGADESLALGRDHDINNTNYGIAIGLSNTIEEVDEAYGIGSATRIQNDREKIVIGFGDDVNGTFLDDLGQARSITLGTYNNSTNTPYNTLNILPPSTASNFSAPVTGIGTTSPDAKLSIENTGGNSSSSILNLTDNSANKVLTVKNNGNVGIGTSSPSNKLSVEGVIAPATDNTYDLGSSSKRFIDIWATGKVKSTSDRRMKEKIEGIGYGIEEIMQLRPVSYKLKGHDNRGDELGLIAQEVDGVIDEAVHVGDGEKGWKALSYSSFIPVLINGMQEQQKQIREKDQKIQNLQQQVDQQKEKIDNMQKRLAKLEKTVFDNREKRQTDSEKSGTNLDKKARLSQNVPNPFDQTTTIHYYLPESVDNARLIIANTNGHVVKEFHLDQRGKGSVQIEGGTLKPGTYPYYLVTEGQRLAGRKLTIIGH